MTTIEELGRRAKQASRQMNRMGTTQKNQILALAAQALVDEQEEILKANAMDIKAAREKNMPEPMVDRLALSEGRSSESTISDQTGNGAPRRRSSSPIM